MLAAVALSGCSDDNQPGPDAAADNGPALDLARDAKPGNEAGPDLPRPDAGADATQPKDQTMTEGSPACAAPAFSPAPGKHTYYTPITITCAGADVRYTLDGSTPGPSSKKYTQALRLTGRLSGRTVRAVAIKGGKASKVVSAAYSLHPGVIVHFHKPAAWAAAHVYYWDTVPGKQKSTWPGPAMQPEAGGWYFHHFKDQTALKLVFNAKGTPQSKDQTVKIPEAWHDRLGDWWDTDPELLRRVAWPGGKYKAVALSYDDGPTQDRTFVKLLNTYGVVGSFNLNSGKLGGKTHVTAAEVKALFAGHEVATHSVSHPYLTKLSPAQIKKELADDRAALEKLVSYKVRGHAYPFGDHDDAVVEVMKQVGLVYGRVVPQTKDLRLPSDLLRWRGSCHHTCAYSLAQSLVKHAKNEMALLFIWGHSWELDGGGYGKDWAHMEAICKLVGKRTDVWYARAIQVADYMLALRKLVWAPELDAVTNKASQSVWIQFGGKAVELKPNATLKLK